MSTVNPRDFGLTYCYEIPEDEKKKRSKKYKPHDDPAIYDEYPYICLRDRLMPGLPIIHKPNPEREGYIVPNYMLLDPRCDSGFHLGGMMRSRRYYVGKSQDQDGHIIIYGGTGSGKSYNNAKPSLYTWKAPAFVIDLKGELVEVAKNNHRPHKVLNLTEKGSLFKYEPFYFLRKDGKDNLAQNAAELAGSIIPTVPNDPNPFWLDSARDVLAGAIIHYCDLGMKFIETMILINSLGFEELVNVICECEEPNETAKSYINPDVLLNPKMYAGISAVFKNQIRVFATDATIQNALSFSDDSDCELITWEDLNTYDIFVRLEQRRLKQWGRVIAFIVTQLIRSLESRPEKHSPEGAKTLPVLLLLDEFPQLGTMDVIADAMATLRSKKVTITLFCQSLADLEARYGVYEAIRINDNCSYKLILSASDPSTQRFSSELAGSKKTVSKSISATYSPVDESVSGISLSLGESSEPAVPPYEFGSLREAILIHPEGFSRIENLSHFIPGHPKNPNNGRLLNP